MPITPLGALNTTALVVPDLYVQIIPPQAPYLNGVPTNVLGIVGTATWGPTNSPISIGSVAQAAALFGPQQSRANDLVTAVAIAAQQGANSFRLVRVTDGSDLAATGVIQANCLTLTSKYTGSFGNAISASLSAGTQSGSWKLVIAAPGLVAESFDNLGVGLSGAALWTAIANSVNAGASALRGPSGVIVATAGGGAAAAIPTTITLSGGTDGIASITTSVLLGQDITPRRGLYALRNAGCVAAMVADLSDPTSYATQAAFGLSEGVYMVMTGPPGDNIANAVATLASAGVDSYAAKLMFGDWVYWLDTVNNGVRLCSPQAFVAGQRAALSPHLSGLNQPLQGIVGTQKSYAGQQYASADFQTLAQGRIDLITNPVPGGAYFALRLGHSTSSNPMTNGDNYATLTNYIAATLNAGMGRFVGGLQSATLRQQAVATLSAYLQTLQTQGMIGDPTGGPAFSVEIDAANNPPARVALGYMQADVQVKYLATVEKFLINVQAGASVQIVKPAALPT